MSQFSGKCDFYDSFCAIHGNGDEATITENLKRLRLYVRGKDGRSHRVKSDTIKDIAKYYPYLEAVMCGEKDGNITVYLASDSFIDQEEREHLGYYIDDVRKYYNKCKRKKIKFDAGECVDKVGYWSNADLLLEIAERFERDGKKAEFDDLHLPLQEHFRREWFDELVRLGYTEYEAYSWCFKGGFDDDDTIIERLGRPINVGEVQPG